VNDNLVSMPTYQDAINFHREVNAGLTKRNHLLPGCLIDYDHEVKEKVKSHDFYTWVDSSPEFQSVIRHLTDIGLMGDFPDRRKIEIAQCVAFIFISFTKYSANPGWIQRTTKATGVKASKIINKLLDLFDRDLQMEDFSDSEDLRRLLQKLKLELSGDLPTTYPSSIRGDLLSRRLVMDTYDCIKNLIGKTPIFVIWQLVETIHKVKEQQVKRHIKEII